jgi:hypothetical protein
MSKQQSKARSGQADKGASVDTIAGRSADSLYFFGNAPVRPGDNRFVLRSVARDGAWLELRWQATVGLEGDYLVRVKDAKGIDTTEDRLVIQRASRVEAFGHEYQCDDGALVVIKAPPDGTAQTMAVGDDPAVLIN